MKFPEEYLSTLFLQKIDGINDPQSPYSTFYSTIITLPDETKTLTYIQERFQNLAISVNSKNTNTQNTDKKKLNQKVNPGPSK